MSQINVRVTVDLTNLSPSQVIAESENTEAVQGLAALAASGPAGGTHLEIFDTGFYGIKYFQSDFHSAFHDQADYCLDATAVIPTGSHRIYPVFECICVFAETFR